MTDEWWRSAVVYQVYPRSFADSDGDGVGDLRGLITHLDHLQYLGVDVIWLSPIYASPHDDNGYDISDYQAIDPTFGTLTDFDELVTDVHSRGMRIVMDLVVNHTSDEHAWFREHRDWYWWRPPRPGFVGGQPGAEPNNWESFFSGSVWQWDEASGEYYLHLFSKKQPDLNWENLEVRHAIYDMMRWWLDRGVDGFRMDVINLISKDPALLDGVVAPGRTWGDGFPHYSYGPRIHEYMREMQAEVFDGREGTYLTVGEMPGVTIEQARRFTDPANDELSMVFQFEHVGLDHGEGGKWDPRPLQVLELKQSMQRWQDGMADVGWNSLYWNNHDQPRVVSRFGDPLHWAESAKLLAAILHLQRGTPYIYQGEEIGMTNVPFASVEELRDIESLNYLAGVVESGERTQEEALGVIRAIGRDNARTPMQWSPGEHGGFSTGEPWLASNPNHATINVEAQRSDPGSILEFYRRLIALRHESRLVQAGSFRMLAPEHPTLFAFVRELDGDSLLVLANMDDATLDIGAVLPLADWADGELVLGNYPATALTDPLRPWEVRVLRA
ncbi:oligo-1,6-glucosidase [soil metagenome]